MNVIRARIGFSVMPKQEEFRKQLSNYVIDYTVEKSLKQVFGETSTRLIYDYFESNHHLRREDIPENLEKFFSSLKDMYGFGARLLEKLVLKKLHTQLGLRYEEKEGYSLSDYIRELKTPKQLKVDEKTVVRPENLDTALPHPLRTVVSAELEADNTTASGVIKENRRSRVVAEQPPEPSDGDKQDKT